MLKTPTAGSPRVSDDGEVLWRQVGDLRYFASIELLLGWLGTRSAVVDGNSVIVPARVLDEDWVGPVRLDLTTNGCYPVRQCLFEFFKDDAHSSLYWRGRALDDQLILGHFDSPASLGGLIALWFALTDPRWRLECWTPVVTMDERVLTVRNVAYRGPLWGSYEECRNPGVLTVTFAGGVGEAEWRLMP